MPENMTLKDWMRAIGLQEDPFEDRNAETDKFLQECFVEPNAFADILGEASNPKSSVLFAPRGGGKTANRVMVDYWCKLEMGHRVGGRVFIVRFTRECLAEVYRITKRAEIEGHHLVREIFRASVVDIMRYLLSHPDVYGRLRQESCQFLKWLVRGHDPVLLVDAQLSELLHRSGLQGHVTVKNIREGLGTLKRRDLERTLPGDKKARLEIFCDVFTGDVPNLSLVKTAPSDLMKRFSDFILNLGMLGTYVLIDGVDEFAPLDQNPALAARFLYPILSDLRLMETSYLAFKFFLPNKLENYILPHIRTDRVYLYNLTWTDKQLLEMLHRRLTTFSGGRLVSLGAISESEIRSSIDERAVACCKSLPRNLIRFGAQLFRTHVANDSDSLLLTSQDLETACQIAHIQFERDQGS